MRIDIRSILQALLLGSLPLAMLTACKPTENNYKAAYEAALNKRKDADENVRGEGHKLIDNGGARVATVRGKSYPIVTDFLKPADNPSENKTKESKDNLSASLTPSSASGSATVEEPDNYRVVVARYKMPTNAFAQASNLRDAGFHEAHVMTDREERYNVVAGQYASLDEAAACAERLMSKLPNTSFVGLDGMPLIIENPRRR